MLVIFLTFLVYFRMSFVEYYFEGNESNFVNAERLDLTLRFVPMRKRVSTSVGELINGIAATGVQPEDISGVYKIIAFDSSFTVEFKYSDTLEHVAAMKKIKVGEYDFDIMKLSEHEYDFDIMKFSEQVASLRVHWLPLYYDSLLLTEILDQFGEVLDVNMLRSAHADCVTFDGVREVRLRTTEVKNQKIPHMVHLGSGQSLLVKMQRRLPYCFKCQSVGHVRQRCPKSWGFAAAGISNPESRGADLFPPAADEALTEVSPGPSDTVDPPQPQGGDDGASDVPRTGSDPQAMDENSNQSLKRPLDSQDSDFIPPNRPARHRQVAESQLDLSNKFSPIMSVLNIMSPKLK